MNSYRRNFGPENVAELNQSIDAQHEELLKTDDLDKKADFQRYLAGYAMQYLYLVPHNKKFVFKETERVLHASAMMIGEFDPREASLAFEHLARYSHNLLEQPWRLDFHVVKLTSGFFVHNIAAHIHNAHELLIAMGYVNIDDVTLKLLPSYTVKSLKAVSRDCYVASQECLILSQIWQRVSDQEPDYPLTIGEVFEFRVKHMGDTDTICKTLLSDIRRRQHEFKMQSHASQQFQNRHFVPVDKLIDYEDVDAGSTNSYYPERDDEIVKKVLENTKMQQESHIYDPVFNGRMQNNENGYNLSPFSPSINSSTNSFSFQNALNTQSKGRLCESIVTVRDKYDRNSASPMIPQTVSSFCSKSPNRNMGPPMNSISVNPKPTVTTAALSFNMTNGHHLNFSKVDEVDSIPGSDQPWLDQQTKIQNANTSGRSRKPISSHLPTPKRKSGPLDSYDMLIHGSSNGLEYVDDSEVTGEDVLNEALEYASEINGLMPGEGRSMKSSQPMSHHRQQTSVPSGWDTDSRSASSASRVSIERDSDKKSASSTDASWDNPSHYRPEPVKMYPSPHNSEKAIIRSNKPNSLGKSSHLMSGTSTEASGIKLYSQPQTVPRENLSRYDQGQSTQPIRPKDTYGSYPRQYREFSSSSSSSPQQFALTHRTLDKLSANDVNRKKYINPSNSVDMPLSQGSSPQAFTSYPQQSFVRSRDNSMSDYNGFDDVHTGIERKSNCSDDVEAEIRSINKVDSPQMILTEQFGVGTQTESPLPPVDKIRPSTMYPSPNYSQEQTAIVDKTKSNPEREVERFCEVEDKKEVPIQPWQCKFCTIVNRKAERICEMCAKSKDFVELEEPILENGIPLAPAFLRPTKDLNLDLPEHRVVEAKKSPVVNCKPDEIQCMRCTLINNSTARECEACGYRLRVNNSPSRGSFDF